MLEELVFGIDPFSDSIKRGRMIIGIETRKGRRPRAGIAFGGGGRGITRARGGLIARIVCALAARAAAVMGDRGANRVLKSIIAERPVEQNISLISDEVEDEFDGRAGSHSISSQVAGTCDRESIGDGGR